MKKILLYTFLTSLFLNSCESPTEEIEQTEFEQEYYDNQESDERYVKIPDLPENLENRDFYLKQFEEMEKMIPGKKHIDIPAYPESYCFASSEVVNNLALLTIISPDSPAKVKKFYKKNLTGWRYDPYLNIFHKGDSDSFDFNHLNTIPNITIRKIKETDLAKSLVPDAETTIDIMYPAKE